jgi:hypothetical protein
VDSEYGPASLDNPPFAKGAKDGTPGTGVCEVLWRFGCAKLAAIPVAESAHVPRTRRPEPVCFQYAAPLCAGARYALDFHGEFFGIAGERLGDYSVASSFLSRITVTDSLKHVGDGKGPTSLPIVTRGTRGSELGYSAPGDFAEKTKKSDLRIQIRIWILKSVSRRLDDGAP